MLLWEKTLTEQSLKLLFYWCIYVNFIESQLALLGIEENLFFFFRIFFRFIKRTLSYKLWLLTSMLAHFMPVVSFDTPCFQGVLKETSSVKWVINSTAIYFSKCFILDAWQGYEYATGYCWYVSDQQIEAASYIYVNHSQHDQFLDIVWPENILVTLVMNHQNGYKKQLELQWRT